MCLAEDKKDKIYLIEDECLLEPEAVNYLLRLFCEGQMERLVNIIIPPDLFSAGGETGAYLGAKFHRELSYKLQHS